MKKIIHIIVVATFSLANVLLPFAASAQSTTSSTTPYQYQTNGIYGCNQTSAAASGVGAFAASGAYVPVSDAAVELNTGYLVYLECSLRPLVDALSGSATAGLIKKIEVTYTQGNNGNPQFSQNINNENYGKGALPGVFGNAAIPAIPVIAAATGQAFQGAIKTALAQSYSANMNNPTGSLACPYSSSQISSSPWTSLAAIGTPSCDVLIDYTNAYDQMMAIGANAVQNNMTLLSWGRGTYSLTSTDANGNVNVVTPGAIILNQAEQALQAGFAKTQNANDIGQMVSSLFAGIGAQAISSAQGLAGITQSSNGQPSYIDQIASAASQNVVTTAVNGAITTLNGVITTLTSYQNSLNTIANTIQSAIQTLRSSETTCWTNIIQNVCVGGAVNYSNGVATCTQVPTPVTTSNTTAKTPSPVTLKVATSTAFSQAVISGQIATLASNTVTNINSLQNTITAVNALVAGVTNTASQAAQTAALQQLDQLTASNSFPTQTNMAQASQQASTISSTMQQLVTNTVQSWEGMDNNTGAQDLSWDGTVAPNSTDSHTTVGWCNATPTSIDPKTQQMWETVWGKQ